MSDLNPLNAWLSAARVLLIDDEPANLTFLRHVLETEGYGELVTISDPAEALERFLDVDPDIVVMDMWMPQLDGFEMLARIRALLAPDTYLPVLVATGDHTPGTRRRALTEGARDFMTKPLSPAEVRLRVRNLLETRFLHVQLRQQSTLLEQRVAERTEELEEARLEMLYRLARAAEFRDDQTGQHTLRVGRMAGRIAQVLGLPPARQELVRRAAPLHDIGKIGIPDAILLKPGRLLPAELSAMRQHTVIGARILSGSRCTLLQLAEEIALTHHERWDGNGYPRGLAREEIPLAGRIVAVADVFDSLAHERPYKSAWTIRDTLAEIEAGAGSQFDPAVVEALLRVAPEASVLELQASGASALELEAIGTLPIDTSKIARQLRSVEDERNQLTREVRQLRRQLDRVNGRRSAPQSRMRVS
jgi:putative two-component system response regulator